MAREDILKSAMQLTEADRILLAEDLLELSPEEPFGWSLDDPALVEQLEIRAKDEIVPISLKDVKAQLLSGLQQ